MTDAPLLDWRPQGSTYDDARDGARLNAQCQRVFRVISTGAWHTLQSLSMTTGDPQASVSARLRDLRKHGYTIEREYVARGLWQYRMVR